MITTDNAMMVLAKSYADLSPNRGRKTSCMFVRDSEVLIAGWNTFPDKVQQLSERFDRPTCYLYIEHAERNAIYAACCARIDLKDSTAYLPWFPCVDCARALAAVRIARMVCIEPNWQEEQYHFVEARTILLESGVKIDFWKDDA